MFSQRNLTEGIFWGLFSSFLQNFHFGLNCLAVQKIVYYHENERFREDLRENKIKEEIRTNLLLVGLFIPDLLKGEEPRRTKHILKVPKKLVFTRNFVTRKEYDYGKVHY